MQELLTKLGIDGRLLLAQIINFVVLIAVLYKFAYKPILSILEKRRARIEKSLEEVVRIEQEAKRMETLKREKVSEARREAAKVLEEAAEKAERARRAAVENTKREAAAVVAKAREQIQTEKAGMLRDVQAETANLVVMATEKVLREKMDEEKDQRFIHETIRQLTPTSSRT